MLLRIASDLHYCFWNYNKFDKVLKSMLPADDRDKDAVLVLAGDIGIFERYPTTIKPFIKAVSERFKAVIYTYGNHEFYNGVWWEDYKTFWDGKNLPSNVYVLEDAYQIIDNVAFIGSTLWTSFNNRDPLAMIHARKSMNDFRCIKHEVATGPYGLDRSITPEMTVDRFERSSALIFESIRIHKEEGRKVVVVTHHAPSFQSVHEKYRGDLLNHAFASTLDERILSTRPDVWVHGHVHTSFDYCIGETRVLVNPFGYLNVERNLGYIERLFVEV